MQGSQQQDIPCGEIDKLRKLLKKVQLSFRIVLGSVFQYLPKLINDDNQELTLLLELLVITVQLVKNTSLTRGIFQLSLQNGGQFDIIANNVHHFKSALTERLRIDEYRFFLSAFQIFLELQQEGRFSSTICSNYSEGVHPGLKVVSNNFRHTLGVGCGNILAFIKKTVSDIR